MSIDQSLEFVSVMYSAPWSSSCTCDTNIAILYDGWNDAMCYDTWAADVTVRTTRTVLPIGLEIIGLRDHAETLRGASSHHIMSGLDEISCRIHNILVDARSSYDELHRYALDNMDMDDRLLNRLDREHKHLQMLSLVDCACTSFIEAITTVSAGSAAKASVCIARVVGLDGRARVDDVLIKVIRIADDARKALGPNFVAETS